MLTIEENDVIRLSVRVKVSARQEGTKDGQGLILISFPSNRNNHTSGLTLCLISPVRNQPINAD